MPHIRTTIHRIQISIEVINQNFEVWVRNAFPRSKINFSKRKRIFFLNLSFKSTTLRHLKLIKSKLWRRARTRLPTTLSFIRTKEREMLAILQDILGLQRVKNPTFKSIIKSSIVVFIKGEILEKISFQKDSIMIYHIIRHSENKLILKSLGIV